ncbi:MAG: hypothetical protein QOC95_568, partial [Thermoleophilaceae bacterium]|nr:hypothetical protein [Thermoleophilaceae bacterium]
LYRSAPPTTLARAGERLREVRAPALVVWGHDDPYLLVEFAGKLAEALGGPARAVVLENARHWPWLDRPELVQAVADFLSATVDGS